MRRWILPVAVGLACLAWTQGPDTPRLGWIVDDAGGLRPLDGMAGNFVPGEIRLAGVVTAASSGQWTLVKTDRELIVIDRAGNETARLAAQGGSARLGFAPGGEPGAAYLAEENLLLLWSDGRFEAANWQAGRDEPVLAIACPTKGSISMLVRRGAAIWRVDRNAADGQISLEQACPGVGAPALLGPDGSVTYADGGMLIRRPPDANEQRVELTAPVLDLNELGSGLVSARTARGVFAVQFLGIQPRVFELPGGGR